MMSGGSRTGSRFIRDLKRRNDVRGSDIGKRASERVDGDEYAIKNSNNFSRNSSS
jgi:hypothetical protein